MLQIARHVARDLNPAVRKSVIQSLVLNGLLQASSTRAAFTARTGAHTPLVLLISPTMRCNLSCEGCYAAEYSPDADMSHEFLQDIIDQANEIGIFIFTILGGEPFIRSDILDLAAENPDSFFQIFTNGTLLTDKTIAAHRGGRQRRPDAQHRGRPRVHRRAPRRGRLRPHHGDHGQARRSRRRLRLLGHHHAP